VSVVFNETNKYIYKTPHLLQLHVSARITQSSGCTGLYKDQMCNYVCNLFLNNQLDALIIQIYCVIKLYMFWASSLPIIRSFLLYIQHW